MEEWFPQYLSIFFPILFSGQWLAHCISAFQTADGISKSYLRGGLFHNVNQKKTVFTWERRNLKGIVRSFEFGGVTRLIRSGIINWRPGNFLFILMIKSHERSIKPFTVDFWDGFVQSKWLTSIFQSTESQFKNQANLRRWLTSTKNGQIPEDDLPRMAKSRKMTYRDGPHPGLRQAGIWWIWW